MYRSFTYLNFSLLLILGGTCIFQWRQERGYGARIAELQSQTSAQENKLQAQAKDLKRTGEDLDGFKQTVATLSTQAEEQATALREQKAKVFVLEAEKEKLSRQQAVWERAVEEHRAAVAKRDDNIRTLLDQREQLAAAQRDAATKANQAVAAYNELTTKYEDVVGRYNTLVTQYQAEHASAAPAK